MAIFQPYFGLVAAMRKEFEVMHGVSLDRSEMHRTTQQLLKMALSCLPQIEGSLNQEALTILFEQSHYLLSHKVYYVETALAQNLMKTNIQLRLSDLNLPYRIFEVSFKEDLQTPEGPIPSFLIAIMPAKAEIDACNEFLKEASPDKLDGNMGSLVYVRYQSPEGGICHANIPASLFANCTIDEAVEFLGKDRRDTFQFTIEFSEADKMIQKNILRIVMGLLCYINTEAPDIKTWKNRNRPAFGPLKPGGWLIGSTLPESWFLRRGHFMVLQHERYKRQDGKTKIVWRRPHEVLRSGKPLVPNARGEIIEKSD